MCFAIPYRVEKIKERFAFVEGGKRIRIDKDLRVKKGDYLQVTGDLAVEVISKEKGLKLRMLIKSLYEN